MYGTEQFLRRCLDSVLNQSYKNLEIIIVNDCSPDGSEQIINEYCLKDDRFKVCNHEKNMGLFQARLTGAAHATGDYIAFLDSDDYVSCDFYHRLLCSAEENQSDIVIGKTVHQKITGDKYVSNFHDMSFSFDCLEGEDVRKTFFAQKGLNYSWHTIWNKLYVKTLWDKAEPYYKTMSGHLIMTEDIAYSSILFYFAQRITTVANDAIFYCENENASTNTKHLSLKKYEKNVTDIIKVFDFVDKFLKGQGAETEILDNFLEFRKYYAKMWKSSANWNFKDDELQKALDIVKPLYPSLDEDMQPQDYFFDSLQTPWNGGLEYAKDLINTGEFEYISFDIFDTLITRALKNPSDLFLLMNPYFQEKMHTNASFAKIRIDGETIARRFFGMQNPEREDITLSEIYQIIEKEYDIPHDIVMYMKNLEVELELDMIQPRKAAKELYELAILKQKKILIISDMYLEKENIEKILANNGYSGYDKLYLSSEIGKTKNSGQLFEYVIKNIQTDAHKVLHIGDTWRNDIENAKAIGIQTFFLPKAMEVFENNIAGVKTNRCASILEYAAGDIKNSNVLKKSVGFGAMLAIVANRYFDNPYRTFNAESDFNIDPYFIGYYTVGMHLVGLTKWLIEESILKGYKKLHFMSRDGYLPMEAYKVLAKFYTNPPKVDYLYSSRKAVMSWMIKSKYDLFDLPIEFHNHSPLSLMKVLTFCSKTVSEKEILDTCSKHRIDGKQKFTDIKTFNSFMHVFLDDFYSLEEHKKNQKICSEYYSKIKENEATVDMGYSGRIQGAISAAVGRGVDVFFIHSDHKKYIEETIKYKFKIHSFYDFTPYMTGLVREHIFSSYEPSCIGFKKQDNIVLPVFEKEKKEYQDQLVISLIQDGALAFIHDFSNIFQKYFHILPIKAQEVSLPYEGFLRYATTADLKIFEASFFEDMVYGAVTRLNIAQAIKDQYFSSPVKYSGEDIQKYFEKDIDSDQYSILLYEQIKNKNKFIKFIVYWFADRENLAVKVYKKLENHKLAFKVARKIYRIFR